MPRLLVTILAILGLSAANANATQVFGGFESTRVQVGGYALPVAVYVPAELDKTLPPILFLHGSGERGVDGVVQTTVGLGPAIHRHPERMHQLVVMPQCPPDKRWESPVNEVTAIEPVPVRIFDLALQALADAAARFGVTADKSVITGLSLGGAGVWELGSAYPEKFAGLLPICGRTDPARMAPLLREMPIWVFHGALDETVPVENSRNMVAALLAAGSKSVHYTEYPDLNHNSWDATYENPEVMRWLSDPLSNP